MHDRAQFWSPVPDWPQVSLRAPGIEVVVVNAVSMWLVSGDAQQCLAQRRISEVLGPRQVCDANSYALRLAPDRLLLVSDESAFDAPLEITHSCAVTDISDGMLIFEIRGNDAAELMAHGSEYPFDDATVLPLESASMQFAGFRLVVSRRAQGWRLHIERPWAAALWRWLQAHVEGTKL
jgi:heterotetrameric sarcosine oxidase gamma subunit